MKRLVGVAIPFRVGWDFSRRAARPRAALGDKVAIPFRVGWDFSLKDCAPLAGVQVPRVAIPFRVGWGFLLSELKLEEKKGLV